MCVVFCPSGRAPIEWCLNSAWLRPANRLPSCSHQLPAHPTLTDSTSSLSRCLLFFFLAFTELCTQAGRLTDRQVDRQTWKGCRYTLWHAHLQSHMCAHFLIGAPFDFFFHYLVVYSESSLAERSFLALLFHSFSPLSCLDDCIGGTWLYTLCTLKIPIGDNPTNNPLFVENATKIPLWDYFCFERSKTLKPRNVREADRSRISCSI